MKKKAVFIAAAIVVVCLILGLAALKNNKKRPAEYRKEILSRGDIEALVVTTGTLNPVSLVEVGSQVSGKIAKIYVDFNSQVKEGQVLAELDQSLLQAKIDQNKANYSSALASLERAKVTMDNLKKKHDRALSLFDKSLVSIEEKEAAEANYLGAKSDVRSADARVEQAKSQLDSSRVDLGYAIIRSPIDGFVILRNINIGQTVAASFQAPVLFKIADDLSHMQVECSIDEADIGRVKEGQSVRFTVDAFPDETFQGIVKQVRYSPEVQQNVVTYTTIVDVKNPAMKLRPGMTATVSVVAGEAKDVLKIPNAALRFTPDLTAEEMQKIMQEAGEKMKLRRPEGGESQEHGAASGSDDRFAQSSSREKRSLTPEPLNQPPQTNKKPPSRVWIEDEKGKLRVAFIRTGVSDSSFTEMLRGELLEGQAVIIGGPSSNRVSDVNRGDPRSPQRMMFIGR